MASQSGTRKSNRNFKKLDYKKLNSKGAENVLDMDTVDDKLEGESELENSPSADENRESSSNSETISTDSESDGVEDGQLISEESEDESDDPEIMECIRTGDVNKLKHILHKQRSECSELQKELKKRTGEGKTQEQGDKGDFETDPANKEDQKCLTEIACFFKKRITSLQY